MDDFIRSLSQADGPDAAAWFEAILDAYVILDENFRICFVNARYSQLTGHTREALIGKSIYEINQYGSEAHRVARNQWVAAALVNLAAGETRSSPPFRAEWPSGPDGKLAFRFWKIKASVIVPANGVRSYYAIRVSDVTERVQRSEADKREKARLRSQAQLRQIIAAEKEKQLQESREQLAEVLAFAKVGAWQRDLLTGVITCTTQAKINLGLTAHEELTTERLFNELIDPVDRDRVRAELDAAIAEHRDYRVEYRVVWPDGSGHWVMVGGRARYGEGGRPTQMLGFVLDITARKQQEIDQQRIAGDERLAREQSDRNALAMDHFLTTVSHELRSPISVILNWAELLDRTDYKGGLPRATATIQRNAKQLALMVDDLLDSGAIVSGKLSIEFAPLALDRLVMDVANDLRLQAEHKGLQLTSRRMEPCTVQGDAARVKQIVWNLVTNAIKFTDAGVIDVSVTCDNGQAVLSVSDSGCGISPDAIDKVFERFEQLRPRSSGRVGGLGLGLWLVKTLVERQHGRIEAHSAGMGRGTTFVVKLPLSA
ncbi:MULTISPECIES: ATP-binding protein [unclassified Caballeronia]|uniref:PAS domain-containing sensor histidine kinase n=1 Tax=unclassified Caballeronia TaxID=2646786 RepID=UPI00286793D3|nr:MULTISPECIES: ATP-binding protein [unclassified Caballeronia]MDR5739240.1 ATP-binding protein [Caballeronia sp. LZ016]MDR5807729.1 ATP-binding protein [Caballeronia sp. LZ019]